MRPTHILLIQDSHFEVVLFKMALTSWEKPFELTVVNDGEQALNLLDKSIHPIPDLIVIDFKLQKKKGTRLLQAIREKELLKLTAVIVFTGVEDRIETTPLENLNATTCIKKPADYDEFKAVVLSMQDLQFGKRIAGS